MKVSKNSWHYRFNNEWNSNFQYNLPTSLCSYFWYTVGTMGKVSFYGLLAVVLGLIIGFGFYTDSLGYADPGLSLLSVLGLAILGLLVMTISIGLFLLISYLLITTYEWIVKKVSKWNDDRLNSKYNTPGKGLMTSFLGAKKKKICPMIEYGD